jgi:hypothetical protein
MTVTINSSNPLVPNQELYADGEIGTSKEEIYYIQQNHELQLRVGGEPYSLWTRSMSGSYQQGTVTTWTITSPAQYSSYIWNPADGQTAHPDTRVKTLSNFQLFNDGVELSRVIDKDSLLYNTEFATSVEITDTAATSRRVRVWLNTGFTPGIVTYKYRNICSCADATTGYPNRECPICKGTSYPTAFIPYVTPATAYHPANTILVRVPLAPETIPVNQIGRVIVRENRHWTSYRPYINNYDIIRGTIGQNKDVLFEVTRKSDSRIRGILLHQQFDTIRIQESDIRYTIIPSFT